MELKTISKSDPQFESYLLGTFSTTHKALPVQTMNVSSEQESITFQIVSNEEIRLPDFLSYWAQVLRLRNFVLIAFPIYIIIMKATIYHLPYFPLFALLSIFSAFLLQSSMNLRNDFQDHFWGIDRVQPSSGSRAIQKGWITAARVKNLSNYFLIFGIVLAIPMIIVRPIPLIVVGLLSAVLMYTASGGGKFGTQYRFGTEFSAFWMAGPLLTIGFQIAIGMRLDPEIIMLGFVTGGLALFILYTRSFENILFNSQAQIKNTITMLGFERSKKFLSWFWFFWIVLLLFYHFNYASTDWMLMSFVFVTLASIRVWNSITLLKSPAGSAINRSMKICRRIAWIIVALWFVEYLTYFVVSEIGN